MNINSRLSAGLIHFAASVCVVTIFVFVVFFVWYPSPLAGLVGVSDLVVMLFGIDVVLGPLMTILVYKPNKKGVKLDLFVVVSIQFCAFLYGAWVISVARPAWVVFTGYRFDLVQANDLDKRFLSRTQDEYQAPAWTGPKWVAARMPTDLNLRNQLIMESTSGGVDMPQRPDLYVPLEHEVARLRANAQPISKLSAVHGAAVMQPVQANWPDADAYFPLKTRSGYGAVLINRERAQIVSVTDLKPFP